MKKNVVAEALDEARTAVALLEAEAPETALGAARRVVELLEQVREREARDAALREAVRGLVEDFRRRVGGSPGADLAPLNEARLTLLVDRLAEAAGEPPLTLWGES